MADHHVLVPGSRARTRRAVREYAASTATAELPADTLVVVDSCSWDGASLRVAVVALEGERRGQIAIVQAGDLVLSLDGEEIDG